MKMFSLSWKSCEGYVGPFQCRGFAMLIDSCFNAGRSDKAVFGVVEDVRTCFGDRNVLKFSLHKCTGCEMLVESYFSAGKIR